MMRALLLVTIIGLLRRLRAVKVFQTPINPGRDSIKSAIDRILVIENVCDAMKRPVLYILNVDQRCDRVALSPVSPPEAVSRLLDLVLFRQVERFFFFGFGIWVILPSNCVSRRGAGGSVARI